MNRYIRALFVLPCSVLRMSITKLFHPKSFRGSVISMISPFTEITLDIGGKLTIGKRFKMRDGAKIRVRKGSECIIGKNTSIGSNNMVACRERVVIGDNVQFGPNVQIYDHDHDYRAEGGISAMKFKTTPVEIGNNVWIGANVVILRGTKIGDNCVIGAGCVVKGEYASGSLVYTQRELVCKSY